MVAFGSYLLCFYHTAFEIDTIMPFRSVNLVGKREIIIKEDSREVVEVIAKEIDDERQRRQQQKNSSSSRTGSPVDRPGRPDVHNVHKL